MAILKIIELEKESFFDKKNILRTPSSEVKDFGGEFQNEVNDLIDTLKDWDITVGLSAPQVGIFKRLFVVNVNENKAEPTLIIVNPIVESISGKKDVKKESCMSLPKFRGDVERRYKIKLNYLDRFGQPQKISAEGFFARVIMHELDHLDGVLYVDRMPTNSEVELVDWEWK
jgi:peptide deformylase